jgi:dihydrofolate synthase/folylpolyglutamate synthase
MPDSVARFHDAVNRLDALIVATPAREDTSREAIRQRARERMTRLRAFLEFLGSPAADIPKVHVGGTSGKGSTTTAIAAILAAAGYRTGVHTSPYLQVASEKLQVDGELIEADRFARLVDHLLDRLTEFPMANHITYGEAWIALVMLFLEDIRADIAVIEVGAGGRFDLTNIIDPELAVITSIGIDHTHTLGDTIDAIAWHKAGIIKHGAPALSAVTQPEARAQMRQEADAVGADLHQLDLDQLITNLRISNTGTSWIEAATGRMWTAGMAGAFQARNGQVAVAAARLLAARGWDIDDEAIGRGLATARIPGRAETMPGDIRVLLDGGHNAQKVGALAADLPALQPLAAEDRRVIVLGALEAKQVDEIIASLRPHAHTIIATSPRVFGKTSRAADTLAEAIRAAGFDGPVFAESDPMAALERAHALIRDGHVDAMLATGSLYLVGNIREAWYPSDLIVAAHTSWPMTTAGIPPAPPAGALSV